MLFSIITAVKNDLEGVRRTASSVLSQTHSDFEWVIILGDSLDGTNEAVREIDEPRVRVFDEEKPGIYPALNQGLRMCRGEYVYVLGAGDEFVSAGSLVSLAREMKRLAKPAWLMARVLHLGATPPHLTATVPFSRGRLALGRQPYNHQALLIRREFMLALGGFPERLGVAADYGLILKAAQSVAPQVTPLPLAVYEGGGASSTKGSEIYILQHRARVDVLELGLFLRGLSYSYARALTIRRHSLAAWHLAAGYHHGRSN